MEREPDWKRMYMALQGKIDEALELPSLFPENIKVCETPEVGMRAAEDIYCGKKEIPGHDEAPVQEAESPGHGEAVPPEGE